MCSESGPRRELEGAGYPHSASDCAGPVRAPEKQGRLPWPARQCHAGAPLGLAPGQERAHSGQAHGHHTRCPRRVSSAWAPRGVAASGRTVVIVAHGRDRWPGDAAHQPMFSRKPLPVPGHPRQTRSGGTALAGYHDPCECPCRLEAHAARRPVRHGIPRHAAPTRVSHAGVVCQPVSHRGGTTSSPARGSAARAHRRPAAPENKTTRRCDGPAMRLGCAQAVTGLSYLRLGSRGTGGSTQQY
jgi:hypothetical protein